MNEFYCARAYIVKSNSILVGKENANRDSCLPVHANVKSVLIKSRASCTSSKVKSLHCYVPCFVGPFICSLLLKRVLLKLAADRTEACD
jgi:hypothetical protein